MGQGNLVNHASSTFVWIGHLIDAPKVAPDLSKLTISLPLSTLGLQELIGCLHTIMKHNFLPTVLSLGASAMAVHYPKTLQQKNQCHIPLLSWVSGTGKTTVLKSALSLFGGHESHFFLRGTQQSYAQHCCNSFGFVDPLSEQRTGQLIIDLYNGAKITSVKWGETKPLTTVLISANFTMHTQVRLAFN